MVVALRAAHCQPEQRGGDDLDLLGDDLVACELEVVHRIARAIGSHAQEGSGDQVVAPYGIEDRLLGRGVCGARQLVAGELLDDEFVPRFVCPQ